LADTSRELVGWTSKNHGIVNPLQPIHIHPPQPTKTNNGWTNIYSVSGQALRVIRETLGNTNLLPQASNPKDLPWTWSVLNLKSQVRIMASDTVYQVSVLARNKRAPFNCTVVLFSIVKGDEAQWSSIASQQVISRVCLLGQPRLAINANSISPA